MKKALFLIILMALAVSSFANEEINRSIYIEGNAVRMDQLEFFYVNFRREAIGMGITLAPARRDAGFILKFDVTNSPLVQEDGNQFVAAIALINNSNDFEILNFNFYFNTLEEVYEHVQSLFFRAASLIPPLTEEALYYANTAWKHKWIYFRASFDYPINFFRLEPIGLFRKIAVFEGHIDSPTLINDLDHKVLVLPGVTAGIEFQFLNFMSLELNFSAFLGDFNTNYFINLAAGAQLKFPITFFRSVVITPYIAGSYPVRTSNIFIDYPLFSFGGGIQVSIKGGNNGAFFIDVNYMHTLTDAVRPNPYTDTPNPNVIHYRPLAIGLGIGYKFGIINRPRRSVQHSNYPDNVVIIEVPVPAETTAEPDSAQETPAEERLPRTRTFYF